jgi:hypothetical protein
MTTTRKNLVKPGCLKWRQYRLDILVFTKLLKTNQLSIIPNYFPVPGFVIVCNICMGVTSRWEKTLDSKVWLQCGPIPISPDEMKMKSMIIVGIHLDSDFRGLLSVKACFESAAKAYLGVVGQDLFRHWWLGLFKSWELKLVFSYWPKLNLSDWSLARSWWLRPVQALVAKVCF